LAEVVQLTQKRVQLFSGNEFNVDLGWGKCVAQMVAAQIFNTNKGKPLSIIYGGVTNGKLWQFLKLEGKDVTIDRHEYYVTPVERILGILKWMADE
jgi:hypothetical protein